MSDNEKHPVYELGEAIYRYLCKIGKADDSKQAHAEIPFQIPGYKNAHGIIIIAYGVIKEVHERKESGILNKYRYKS